MPNETKTDPNLELPEEKTVVVKKKKVILFGGLGLLLLLLAVIVSFVALSKGCEAEKKTYPSVAQVDGKADAATTKAALAKKADIDKVNAALKKSNADLAKKADAEDLAKKADKADVTTAQETADKALEVACRNHPKDPKCVKAPDPNAEPEPDPKPEPVKPTPKKWRASKWTKPVRHPATSATTTDPALERRVSNLETRMARQEYLTTPLSEYADKHKDKYLERARARLEALDRLPATNDKVQGESK